MQRKEGHSQTGSWEDALNEPCWARDAKGTENVGQYPRKLLLSLCCLINKDPKPFLNTQTNNVPDSRKAANNDWTFLVSYLLICALRPLKENRSRTLTWASDREWSIWAASRSNSLPLSGYVSPFRISPVPGALVAPREGQCEWD